jgi:hypothetical protein
MIRPGLGSRAYQYFDNEQKQEVLALRLSKIGPTSPEDALRRRPSFRLSLLVEPGRLDGFLAAFNWMLSEIKSVESDGNHHVTSADG